MKDPLYHSDTAEIPGDSIAYRRPSLGRLIGYVKNSSLRLVSFTVYLQFYTHRYETIDTIDRLSQS